MHTTTETLPAPGRHAILAAICLAALVLPMSFTGGAVATPFIGQTFAAHPTQLAWITNAFMLSFGSLLMAAGTLADRYGRKRLFLWGMALFTGASLWLTVAPGMLWLDALRALQGVAAPSRWPAVVRRWPRNLTGMRARAPSACWAPPSARGWRLARCCRGC